MTSLPDNDEVLPSPGTAEETEVVPISAVLPSDSPRLGGEDRAHIVRLAGTEAPLPPVLVNRRTMRVVDGMHRLWAAMLRGADTIEVRYFDGSDADAFLRGVMENVRHGLPLSLADRRAAAARIVASHPQLSDRAIAAAAGLGAKTVAGIRERSTGAVPQLNTRIGRDGRVRPLDGREGRQRAARLLAADPEASLRQVAAAAGISPATVRDVRERLRRGQDAAGTRGKPAPAPGEDVAAVARPAVPPERKPAPARGAHDLSMLEKLLRDPSLRHTERGRELLQWLRRCLVHPDDCQPMVDAVPPHWSMLVAALARQCSRAWQDFAGELEERGQAGRAATSGSSR